MVYNKSIFMKVTECVMKAMATRFMNNEPKASFGRQFSCAHNIIVASADVGIVTSVFYAVIISVVVRIRRLLFNDIGYANAFL